MSVDIGNPSNKLAIPTHSMEDYSKTIRQHDMSDEMVGMMEMALGEIGYRVK